jgi:hypothetical protein
MTTGKGSIKLNDLVVKAVPTVADWSKSIYMVVRGGKGDNDPTVLLEMDKDFDIKKKHTWFPIKAPNDERLCLLGHDTNLHCFFRHMGIVWGQSVFGPGDFAASLKEIGGRENPLKTTAFRVGVASHSDGIIVVMDYAAPVGKRTKIEFYLTDWSNLYSSKNVTRQTIELPSEYDKFLVIGAEAVCVLVPPSHTQSKDMELHLIWGMTYLDPKTNENGLLFGECNVVAIGTTRAIDPKTIIWTRCPQENPCKGQITMMPRLHLGIEGRAYAMTCFKAPSPTASTDDLEAFAELPLSADEVLGIQLWTREKPGKWIDQGNPMEKAGIKPRHVYLVGSIADVSGKISTEKNSVNDEVEDKFLPVERAFFYLAPGKENEIFYSRDNLGKLRRRGLAKITGGQDQLLGIIQGPPPVPNENINIPKRLDDGPRGKGVTTFAKSEKVERGYKVKRSVGAIAQASAEIGAVAKGFVEASLAIGYKLFYEAKSGEISTTKYQIEIKLQGPEDKQTVQPYGAVIVLRSEWEGYAYEYVAPDGSVPPSATIIFQVWPTGMVVVTEPYVMNPYNEPIPGNLPSYIISPEQRKIIEEKATLLQSGQKRLTSAWSLNSKTVSSFESYAQEKFSKVSYLDAKMMIGAGWEVKEWSKGKFMAGAQVSFEDEWESQKEDKLGLSTTAETRGHLQAKGTYYHYTYFTYQLRPDQQWTKELLQNLVTEEWPPKGSPERKANERLQKRIAEGSQPWKIVYVLGDHGKNELLKDIVTLNSESLRPELLLALQQAGIETTAQLEEWVKSLQIPR